MNAVDWNQLHLNSQPFLHVVQVNTVSVEPKETGKQLLHSVARYLVAHQKLLRWEGFQFDIL